MDNHELSESEKNEAYEKDSYFSSMNLPAASSRVSEGKDLF
jgi:hypothetical protein